MDLLYDFLLHYFVSIYMSRIIIVHMTMPRQSFDWPSQFIQIGGIGFIYIGMSSKKQQNHSTSTDALIKAIRFDFIVDLVMQVCLEYFLDTVAPPSAKIYPLTGFVTFVSFI